ncbi:MAG: hypothetical protein H6651_17405 [Ardenticatenales bacterium]|nr:hypothetical protein [Ardenticatenales bacterium]
MRRLLVGLIAILVFIFLFFAPSLVRRLSYYSLLGGADRAEVPVYEPVKEEYIIEQPVSTEFVDEPAEVGSGLILVDLHHQNDFDLAEIRYLDNRLAVRGHEIVTYTGQDLESALRSANAFVVIAPLSRFSESEVRAVADFVDRGGRLLLVGDPNSFAFRYVETEFQLNLFVETDDIPLNSLANEFDIIFNGDYAFNVDENDANFKNIIVNSDMMSEGDLFADIEQLVLYGTHSLDLGGDAAALITADDLTFSSVTDRAGGLVLAASAADDNVLAIGDIDFLFPPNYTAFDNSRFIAHIADFLTSTEARAYTLAEFPYFYDAETVDVIYTGSPELGPNAFDEIIALDTAFEPLGINVQLASEPDDDNDVLYLGLYNQVGEDVLEILNSEGISLTIDPVILTADELAQLDEEEEDTADEEEFVDEIRVLETSLGNIQMSGTAMFLLVEDGDQQSLIVLAASSDGLQVAVSRLIAMTPRNAPSALQDCLLQENLALCPTGISSEPIEAELDTGGTPAPVVVPPPGGNGGGSGSGQLDEDLNALIIGPINIGETVSGELEGEVGHGYTFSSGPAVIDITLGASDELDGVIEVYDANKDLVNFTDNTFGGEDEVARNVEIESGTYTIVVRDFFGDPAGYTLSVTEAVGGSGAIFIYSDDDGDAGTATSAADIADLLSPIYPVVLFEASSNPPLTEADLEAVSLVIWDSGDYVDASLDEDDDILLAFLSSGGNILFLGGTPTLFTGFESAPLSDVRMVDTGTVLTEGFEDGQIISLTQTVEAAFVDVEEPDIGEIWFMFRGPNSPNAGTVISFVSESDDGNSRFGAVFLPYWALPEDEAAQLLFNLIEFYGVNPG